MSGQIYHEMALLSTAAEYFCCRLSPLLAALQHANETERKAALEGIAILRRLLTSMDELENN